jgi:solute carrier family 25 protein 39/40
MVRIGSSSVGSIATAFAVTPLDVVKVRQQAMQQNFEAVTKDALALCGRCGLFILNNGLIHGEMVMSKGRSPHFQGAASTAASAASKGLRGGTVGAAEAAAACGATCACPPSTMSAAAASSAAAAGVPESTLPALLHIYRAEGLAGIYAGLAPTLVMAVPATVLYFSAYDELKARFAADPRVGPTAAPPLAGTLARVLASMATSPFELVRTIAQSGDLAGATAGAGLLSSSSSSSSSSSGRGGAASVSAAGLERRTLWGGFRAILASGGVPALWRGLEPTLWRDVPFSALYWFAYEQSKARLVETFPSDHPAASPLRAFVAGAGAGMLAAATTTPFDVVKTRRQVYSSVGAFENEGTHAALDGNGSTPRVLRAIIREEGVAGAFRGFNARLIKIAPACAIMISSYEAGKRAFGLVD